MNRPVAKQSLVPQVTLDMVYANLGAGTQARCDIGESGSLYIDRPLPFLCVYREPHSRDDLGTRELVQAEASYLIVPRTMSKKDLQKLVETVVRSLQQRFQAFLIVELWSSSDAEVHAAMEESDLEPTELRPTFEIVARGPNVPMRTVESLRRHLSKITYLKQQAEVDVNTDSHAYPESMYPLLAPSVARQLNCETIGLRTRPIYRNPLTGELYPAVLRALKRGFGRALKQAFFTFSKTHTNSIPEHFYSLGRRSIVKAVKQVDKQLNVISSSFSFLLQVTPVNAEAAWREFRKSRFEKAPHYYYRPLAVEPGTLKRRLFELPIDKIEDPTLAELFRQRQDELDRKITMLTDVGTRRFLLGSQQVYGNISKDLLKLARGLLSRLSVSSRADVAKGQVSAAEFAERATEEILYYRSQLPEFTAEVVIRDDIYSGLMCSDGNLLIGRGTRIPVRRIEALLQHEVGTHLLTHYNGMVEPFQLLHTGLAGYDSLQEGLAVITEYLVGGLSKSRLRLLAARVLAVHMLLEGATFVETFRELHKTHGFPQRTAYTITMRIYRGGGFTKDAVYLRGLVEMLEYLGTGGDLPPLFVGKIASEHIRFIRELLHRKVIKPAAIRPRYLNMPGVDEKIEKLGRGMTVFDLIIG